MDYAFASDLLPTRMNVIPDEELSLNLLSRESTLRKDCLSVRSKRIIQACIPV